jgi:aminoglycoside phosphotransferase (APT) family kinase protein
MLLPSEHVLASLAVEFNRLRTQLTDGEASAVQSIGAGLALLTLRERGDVTSMRAQLDRLAGELDAAIALLPADSDLHPAVRAIGACIERARHGDNLRDTEAAWREVLRDTEKFARQLAADSHLDPAIRTRIGLSLNAWEIADLQAPFASATASHAQSGVSTEITAARLCEYLRDRFRDPTIEVPMFRPLAGGFGKQTFLFDVAGREFAGAYVMRRDLAEPVIDNDCHRIDIEYALIRAVHERGFPAPEALWVDCDHALLPGGNFLIMRRAPGTAGGSVFTASGQIPKDLLQTLAGILVRLHALPPMPALSALTPSLNSELWSAPLDECVRRYIGGFRSLYERELHLPSPALASLFGWLLDNVPPMQGHPVLLHGDIGFHNFLFDQGRLTAVLDWEFGHLGDPAEDLAYACNTLGAALDTQAFLNEYRKAGGVDVDAQRIRFFRVWGHVRNACASNLITAKFASGRVDDLKLALLPHVYIPQFLGAAMQLIKEGAAA